MKTNIDSHNLISSSANSAPPDAARDPEPEARPLRSVEEILEERLEQRKDRDEDQNGGDGPNVAGDHPPASRSERGGIPDEDFPGRADERQTADSEELPSGSDRRSSAFREVE